MMLMATSQSVRFFSRGPSAVASRLSRPLNHRPFDRALLPAYPAAATIDITITRQSSTMRAVIFDGKGASIDPRRQIPTLRDDCILVRPVAVALNPTDWKHVRFSRAKSGCIIGCDYAGVVEAVGSAVQKRWQPGDRIFGCAHGANFVNPDDGVFAEFAVVKGDLQMRIPKNMSFEQAATLGLGTITVGQGLYQKSMQLNLPSVNPKRNHEYVLINGGGTSTAALGIQFAKQSGYSVVTICGPESFDYVLSLGAELALDYGDKDVGAKVRKHTNNRLRYAWDTIGIDSTAQICAESLTSLSDLKPAYGTINPQKCPRSDVKSTSTVMYTVFGQAFEFGPVHMPASVEDFDFGKMFYGIAEELYIKGLVRPHRHRVGSQGLEGIPKGLKDLEAGKVQGEKLVFLVNERP